MLLKTKRPLRILDLDTECRPLSWYGMDWNSKEITAIATRFLDRQTTKFFAIHPSQDWEGELQRMLEAFLVEYNQADIVTGHFIRGFDLPLINGALFEVGMPPLPGKEAHDTKIDLIRFSGHSKSQENLGALLKLEHDKIGMTQAEWRLANRLSKHGIRRTKERVCGDVEQHIELRGQLLRRGYLNPPKYWSPGTAHVERYHP